MSRLKYEYTLVGRAHHLDPEIELALNAFHVGMVEGETMEEILPQTRQLLHDFADEQLGE